MGIPPPPEDGIRCAQCFGLTGTPKKVWAAFSGIIPCPLAGTPPNDTFLLTQDPLLPCEYNYIGPIYQIHFRFVIPNAGIIALSNNRQWFVAALGINCQTEFESSLVICLPPVIIAVKGTCKVTWP